ncbi:MAG: hypothetical protein QOI82_2638 [Actinomycetota bacterium]|nr:hypothetical protein [Actinomycetota bacterium]
MTIRNGERTLPPPVQAVVDTALGRGHRPDPVVTPSGGPAGNAQLTAWLGLTLLVLFLAELVTVLDVRGLISWHIGIGVLLIPPSILKAGTTSWRVVRYYRGEASYVHAGPPPLLLRALGPLVVLGTFAVLGTGVLVTLLGRGPAEQPYFRLLGNGVSPLTLHQASVIVWAVATGLHVLARLASALQLLGARSRLPGVRARVVVLAIVAVVAAILAGAILASDTEWTHGRLDRRTSSVAPAVP